MPSFIFYLHVFVTIFNGNVNSYNKMTSLTEIRKNKTYLVFEFMILFHVCK